jgi:membrane-bound ClpP family serine protease
MARNIEKEEDKGFALGKENLRLLAIGFAIIVFGFILMSGGGSSDPSVFNKEIFSFQRITLAPIICLIGFIFEIYAIMKKPKSDK